MTLLEETVRELKGEEVEDDVRAAVNLRVDLKIEETYIPDMNQRLMIYRQMASARREEDLERTLADVRDRYGPLPPSVLNLADYGRIRIMADRLGIEAVDREAQVVVFRFRPQAKLDPAAARGAREQAAGRHAGATGRPAARSARRHVRAARPPADKRRSWPPRALAGRRGGAPVALARAGAKAA